MGDAIEDLKAAEMYNSTGGPTYVERHRHRPDEPCSMFCPGSPAKLGGNGEAISIVYHTHGPDDPCPGGCPVAYG